MLSLIKYDFMKLRAWLVGYLCGLVFANLLFILSFKVDLPSVIDTLAKTIFVLFCFASPVMLFIFMIVIFSTDVNNKHGYMTFLTPRSAAQIVGSKVIVSFILLITVGFVILGAISLTISALSDGDFFLISELAKLIGEVFEDDVWTIFLIIVYYLFSVFRYILMIDLAIVVSAALFGNGGKNKGLVRFITVICYFAFSSFINGIDMAMIGAFGKLANATVKQGGGVKLSFSYATLGALSAECFLICFGLFILITYLIDKKMSM